MALSTNHLYGVTDAESKERRQGRQLSLYHRRQGSSKESQSQEKEAKEVMARKSAAAQVDEELLELYYRASAATRNGDLEEAADAVLQATCYQGIVNGNTKALELFMVGSGVIQGIQQRQRAARNMAASAVKLLGDGSELSEEEKPVDYEKALRESGKE